MGKKVISLQFQNKNGIFSGKEYTYFIDLCPSIEQNFFGNGFIYSDVYLGEIVKSNGASYSKGHKTRIINIWDSFEAFKKLTGSPLEEKDLYTISKYKMTFGNLINLEFNCNGTNIVGTVELSRGRCSYYVDDGEYISHWLHRYNFVGDREITHTVFDKKFDTEQSFRDQFSSSPLTIAEVNTVKISDLVTSGIISTSTFPVTTSSIVSTNTSKNNERNKNMDFSKMFNISFGKIFSDDVRASLYGIAVKGGDNRFRAFDKNSDKIMDVTGMVFDSDMLFTIPIAVSAIKKGDVIINAGNYVTVTAIHPDSTLTVIDLKASEQKIAIPAKNMFGFDFVSKVYCPFEGIIGTPSNDNPFGINPLMFMFLGDDMDNTTKMMMAMSMMGGNADQSMLLPMMMMGNKDKDKDSNSDMLMVMCMMNMQKQTKENRSDYVNEAVRKITEALNKTDSPAPVDDVPETIKVTE